MKPGQHHQRAPLASIAVPRACSKASRPANSPVGDHLSLEAEFAGASAMPPASGRSAMTRAMRALMWSVLAGVGDGRHVAAAAGYQDGQRQPGGGAHGLKITPPAPRRTSPMSCALSPASRSELRAASALARIDDHHHADPAVEGAVHLGVADVAAVRQPVEHRIARPGRAPQLPLRSPRAAPAGYYR